MTKQARLSTLPKGYQQTIVKNGNDTIVIRLTRDYDKNKKRIARTYILSDDGDTLQYAGYFTPNKKDTKSIFQTRQNPNAEGRNKAIRNIASKAVPSDSSKPVKLDARPSRKPSKASSKAVKAPKAETQPPMPSQPESPVDELETALNELERIHAERQQSPEPYTGPSYPELLPDNGFEESYDDHGFIEPAFLTDEEAWELHEPENGEWTHDYLSYLWASDPVNHNLNKINWLFLGFSDLKARGMLDGSTQEHDSLILRAHKQFPDILTDNDIENIRQYARRLNADEFNDVWESTLDMMGMENEDVFKYQPDEFMSAMDTNALFYHNLAWMLRDAYEAKINNIYKDDDFHIIREWE